MPDADYLPPLQKWNSTIAQALYKNRLHVLLSQYLPSLKQSWNPPFQVPNKHSPEAMETYYLPRTSDQQQSLPPTRLQFNEVSSDSEEGSGESEDVDFVDNSDKDSGEVSENLESSEEDTSRDKKKPKRARNLQTDDHPKPPPKRKRDDGDDSTPPPKRRQPSAKSTKDSSSQQSSQSSQSSHKGKQKVSSKQSASTATGPTFAHLEDDDDLWSDTGFTNDVFAMEVFHWNSSIHYYAIFYVFFTHFHTF